MCCVVPGTCSKDLPSVEALHVFARLMARSMCVHICSGGIRTMMITGDYHHTGISVARDVGMLKPQGEMVIIDTIPPILRQSSLLGAKAPHPPTLKSAAFSPGQRSFKRSVSFAVDALGAAPSSLSTRRSLKRCVSFAADVCDSDHESDQDQRDPNMHAAALDEEQDRLVGHASSPEGHVTAQPLLSAQSVSCGETWDISRARQDQTSVVVANPPVPPGLPLEGLRVLATGQETLQASEALHALAEGQLQCAVTGEALEHLLQQHDLSVLETVMRNALVFSRMKPHQKGQVMDLLGMSGIHQMFQGHARYIPVGASRMFAPSNIIVCPCCQHCLLFPVTA